jgi:hypothetical protein
MLPGTGLFLNHYLQPPKTSVSFHDSVIEVGCGIETHILYGFHAILRFCSVFFIILTRQYLVFTLKEVV